MQFQEVINMGIFELIGLIVCIFMAPRILRGDLKRVDEPKTETNFKNPYRNIFAPSQTGPSISRYNRPFEDTGIKESLDLQRVEQGSLEDYGLSPRGRI